MQKQAFIVTYGGTKHTVDRIGFSDLVAFERQFQLPASVLEPTEVDGQLVANVRLEWIGFLVWRGLRRLGVIAKEVAFDDDFLDSIENIESVVLEDEAELNTDPTDAGPQPA